MGGALAFWMGNPVLNPATLVFMGFVLGWGFAAIRLVAGLVMVLLIATLVQKWVRETPQTQAPVEIDIPEAQGGHCCHSRIHPEFRQCRRQNQPVRSQCH